MAKVDRHGPRPAHCPELGRCWIWLAAHFSEGYGAFGPADVNAPRVVGAHRWSYEHFNGPIPAGAFVLHACDVKDCVNPTHLKLGDAVQNGKEAAERKRNEYGDTHYMRRDAPKLSQTKADAIRTRYAAGGMSQSEIAREFGISQPMVCAILKGRRW